MVCKAQRRCGQPFARQQFLPVVDVNVDFRVRKKGLQRFLGQFWAAAAALPLPPPPPLLLLFLPVMMIIYD